MRDYGSARIRHLDYDETFEAHDRGSILVFAVYEAFLQIVDRRTDDLMRLATGGTGVLPRRHLHPDLVDRLTDETCKTRQQCLRMCIRALDYCPAGRHHLRRVSARGRSPPTSTLVPDDPLHYRLAFMEAFRKWKLLPRDVRTVSEETLAWSTPDDPSARLADRTRRATSI